LPCQSRVVVRWMKRSYYMIRVRKDEKEESYYIV
jgi:hypothetical protein